MDRHSNCAIHGYLDRERGKGSQGLHLWMVHGTVTVASMDSLTEGGRQGVHPWMDSNCAIHGYLDRERGRAAKVSIYGWSMDGTVTVASMDTLTEGDGMVHGWTQ